MYFLCYYVTLISSVYIYIYAICINKAVSYSVYVHAILVYFAHSANAYTFQKLIALPTYFPQD